MLLSDFLFFVIFSFKKAAELKKYNRKKLYTFPSLFPISGRGNYLKFLCVGIQMT